MLETTIVQGRILITGKVHGALNTTITVFSDPQNWEMKQFVSQEALEQFAAQNHYVIQREENERF